MRRGATRNFTKRTDSGSRRRAENHSYRDLAILFEHRTSGLSSQNAVRLRERQRRQVHRERSSDRIFPSPLARRLAVAITEQLLGLVGFVRRAMASTASLFSSSSTAWQGHACPCACLGPQGDTVRMQCGEGPMTTRLREQGRVTNIRTGDLSMLASLPLTVCLCDSM
ncbi:unnamed protein product [Lasius platythorax]|uniref:Uncharacterized protein n=1 Tax=Lasius platythorax TaxID=488582 RepID=A0AAV2N7Y1_9HYME